MALAIDTGDDEELAAVRKKLKVALTAGVELEEAPDPLLEDYEAALSVSAFETTEATPASPDPMTATPPAIGTVSAPNAESIDRTDIATTSWGGVPGSPKKPARLAVEGSGSPLGMGADACPRSPVFGDGGYNFRGGHDWAEACPRSLGFDGGSYSVWGEHGWADACPRSPGCGRSGVNFRGGHDWADARPRSPSFDHCGYNFGGRHGRVDGTRAALAVERFAFSGMADDAWPCSPGFLNR